MKIRNGFVSNSSSSSFIIARKDGCTQKDIVKILKRNINVVEKYIRDNDEMLEQYDLINQLMAFDQKVDSVVENLASELFDLANGIRLDTWLVNSAEFGNENYRPLSNFIYEYFGGVDSDMFIIEDVG